MHAIIGLGNPGQEYAFTRHNVGFMVVDALAAAMGAESFRNEHAGLVAKTRVESETLLLVKPQTFMNLSGNCIGMISGYFKLLPEEIIVICDDMDLPLGSVRLRQKGGSGGHNGLKSIQAALGTEVYPRIRIGIGRRQGEETSEVIGHVLGRFDKGEEKAVQAAVQLAAKASISIVKDGIVRAMNEYNPLGKIKLNDSPA